MEEVEKTSTKVTLRIEAPETLNLDQRDDDTRNLQASLHAMRQKIQYLTALLEKLLKNNNMDLLVPTPPTSYGAALRHSTLSPVRKSKSGIEFIVVPDTELHPSSSRKYPHENWSGVPQLLSPPFKSAEAASVADSVSLSSSNASSPLKTDRKCCQFAVSQVEKELQNRVETLEKANKTLESQVKASQESEITTKEVVQEFASEVEDLKSRIHALTEEKEALKTDCEALQTENQQLREQVAAPSNTSSEDNQAMEQLEHESTDGLGSTKGHEKCQRKIHELWQTVKTMKAYVEAFRVERSELNTQRDRALASAEQAWEENAKLAGHTNNQQKIQYLQTLKGENIALRKRVRDLEMEVTAKNANKVMEKFSNNHSEKEPVSSNSNTSVNQYVDGVIIPESTTETERNVLFRKMWERNKKLQFEMERLKEQQRRLGPSRSRTNSEASRSSCSSTHPPATWR